MKEIRITRQEADDQRHINAAYRKARRVVNELRRVSKLDSDLARVLRTMYDIEDTLSQYVCDLDGNVIEEE